MKVPAFLVPVCLSLLVFSLGCSGDDEPSALSSPPKVVQTIKQPLPEQKRAAAPAAEKMRAEQVPEEKASSQDNPQTPKGGGAEQETPSKGEAQNPVAEKQAQPAEAAQASPQRPGCYVVKKGDTLSKVAADTMSDPLKWPILLRLNPDKLAEWPNGVDFAARELPPGIELRYISPSEAKEGVKKPSQSLWVINVISGLTEAEIVPFAVILARQGYPVYIARAKVKEKDYFRLRVGFFNSGKAASEQGEKIKDLLKFNDSWLARPAEAEYEEIAGFLKTP